MKQSLQQQTASNSPPVYSGGITIKSERELQAMRRAGAIVAETIAVLKEAAQPGTTTAHLGRIANREIRKRGAVPTFKGYRGFPGTICASVNEEIVHGIPGSRILEDGDLLKVDVGATIDGFIGDSAVTIGVGNISEEAAQLMEVTEQALHEGIAAAVDGARTGDIGQAVEQYAVSRGYSIVTEYVGHGIGRFLHEDPQVPNYGPPGRGARLRENMTIAIEPMVNIGGWKTRLLPDLWTVVTADGSLSSHFEHTIAINKGKAEILTQIR